MGLQAEILENIPWTRVGDWSDLTSSRKSGKKGRISDIREKDIDDFVAKRIRKISERLKMPYDDVRVIINRNNGKFYQEKKKFFTNRNSCSLQEPGLRYLENTLIIPDIDNKSSKCYLIFGSLTSQQKQLLLEAVQRVVFCREEVEYLQKQKKS